MFLKVSFTQSKQTVVLSYNCDQEKALVLQAKQELQSARSRKNNCKKSCKLKVIVHSKNPSAHFFLDRAQFITDHNGYYAVPTSSNTQI